MKPVTYEKVYEEMLSLRHPITPDIKSHKLFVRAFGNFEVFVNGKQILFRRAKTKELLAYLVDRRGASITMGELMAVLWEDGDDSKSLQSHLRTLISDLRSILKENDIEDAITKGRNVIAINLNTVACDYYSFLSDPINNLNLYRGEYMSQYSWAEITNAQLMGTD